MEGGIVDVELGVAGVRMNMWVCARKRTKKRVKKEQTVCRNVSTHI